MKNVKATVTGSKLVLEIDLDARHGVSSSGKSETIASSEGNQTLEDPRFTNVKFGLNVYVPVKKS